MARTAADAGLNLGIQMYSLRGYPVDAAAGQYGASVTAETSDPSTAYTGKRRRRPARYRDSWLPQ